MDDGKLMWVLKDSIDSSISFGSEFVAQALPPFVVVGYSAVQIGDSERVIALFRSEIVTGDTRLSISGVAGMSSELGFTERLRGTSLNLAVSL